MANDSILIELERASRDVIRVHNPSTDDYVVEWDKSKTNTLWVIPGAMSDKYNCGRGNRDVPRYIALKFMTEMVDNLINRDAKNEWEVLRKNYGKTEYVAREEERIMMNFLQDQDRRDKYRKTIWLGIVQRHGDEVQEEKDFVSVDRTKPAEVAALERLGLDDKVVKDEFVKEVSDAKKTK